MPRYFFHVSDGAELPDDEGTVLADPAAARRQAAALLGGLMADAPEHVWDGHDWQVQVKDETGLHLFSIHVVTVESPLGSPRPSLAGGE